MKKREVICIIDDSSYLTKGKKYEVISESEMQCQVVDDELDLLTCPLEDFKPVKNKSKKAKKIKMVTCTSKNYVDSSCLTIDKKYLVLGESETCYKIIDDNNNEFYYQKTFFKPVKNKSKKAKKIKALRLYFETSSYFIKWCCSVVAEKGNVPQSLIMMQELHRIGLEEIRKEKPNLKRIKFLSSEMWKLIEQTIKD